MNVVLPIPDDLATRLSGGEPDLARQALEGLAAEAYRAGRLTAPSCVACSASPRNPK